MHYINGISLEDVPLQTLKDGEREGAAKTYFYGAVMEISLAVNAPDIYTIWQEARGHLAGVYTQSIFAEEDFFVLDVGLARVVRQRAQQLCLPQDELSRRDPFTSLDHAEMASLYDMERKSLARECFLEAVEAMETARTGKELMQQVEMYDLIMAKIYHGSEFKQRELSRWLNMLGRRFLDNSRRLSKKRLKKP